MIGYVGMDEQVDKDFHRVLRRASLHRLRDRVLRRSADGYVFPGGIAQPGREPAPPSSRDSGAARVTYDRRFSEKAR